MKNTMTIEGQTAVISFDPALEVRQQEGPEGPPCSTAGRADWPRPYVSGRSGQDVAPHVTGSVSLPDPSTAVR
jgi:hypothetical protein